jgi:hypothetical protein
VSYVCVVLYNGFPKDLYHCRCFCAAAGGSFFQCSSIDPSYNRLHAETFPDVVNSASAREEMQTLLARIALVREEGGDMFGVVADIQEWLLSLSDTDGGSWVSCYPVMPLISPLLLIRSAHTHTVFEYLPPLNLGQPLLQFIRDFSRKLGRGGEGVGRRAKRFDQPTESLG